MDWSIQEISKLAGTTSRTLRHYGDVGLLEPSRIGSNGYRYYDDGALVRLQRILLLRELGLGLPAINEALRHNSDSPGALRSHLQWLRQEEDRLARQIASVEETITRLEGGEQLMAENMFKGFDHTQHKDEVEERWGKDAYATSDRWWRSKSGAENEACQVEISQLSADWSTAAASGGTADSELAQSLARRQFDWLSGMPGLPASGGKLSKEYFVGLGEMYVADDRFGANYGGKADAEFVRDAMAVYAEKHL
ncbi:MerR family transcriptional regulator [Arthrobacter sp. H5]|uniref:MerR family transcriptional regulator n=1 Tax=Arthrobacter sp. H5 TaxID=1267973 RepID=UPI0004885C64|nr:MerR family transcriptional regulator [Arthrobacter sp. H5]